MLNIPSDTFDKEYVVDMKTAGLLAEAKIRMGSGWLVEFNKPITVSYDGQQQVWIAKGSSGFFGGVLGAMSDPVFVIGKDGSIKASFCSTFLLLPPHGIKT
jgi:hypothetical protein